VQRIHIDGGCSGRGTDTLSLFRNSGEVAELQCNATTRFSPQRRHLIFLRVHLLDINISYSGTMTDRAAKRLRRLSTEYDDSEENTEWNNSRYVADIPSRLVAPSFIAPRARGETQGGHCGFEQTISCRGSRNRQANAMTAHHRSVPPAP
jgi:hypothetical protein